MPPHVSSDRSRSTPGSGFFGALAAWRERRYAAACCRDLLALLPKVAQRHPGVGGEALYLEVVAAYLQVDLGAAEQVLRGAEESYAIWPARRELTFRDIGHYLAVTGFDRTHGSAGSISSDIRPVVDATIPGDL